MGKRAFKGCTDLEKISDSDFMSIPRNVKYISESLFEGCTSLKKVLLSDEIKEIGDAAFCGCEKLSDIRVPSQLAVIGERAFENCSIGMIRIPETTEKIKKHAFKGCGTMKIYCVSEKRPREWSPNWAGDYCRIIWNAKQKSALQ